jgi:hypothetical protein
MNKNLSTRFVWSSETARVGDNGVIAKAARQAACWRSAGPIEVVSFPG